jgi:hypothetical protein
MMAGHDDGQNRIGSVRFRRVNWFHLLIMGLLIPFRRRSVQRWHQTCNKSQTKGGELDWRNGRESEELINGLCRFVLRHGCLWRTTVVWTPKMLLCILLRTLNSKLKFRRADQHSVLLIATLHTQQNGCSSEKCDFEISHESRSSETSG